MAYLSEMEFKQILAGIQCAYPRYAVVTTDEAFKLWYASLKDIDAVTLKKAAQQHIMTAQFPPSISELRQRAYNITAPPDNMAAAEWDRLMRALSHAHAPDSQETWENLPSLTKELVGGYHSFLSWSSTPTEQLESVQRPMFIKRFENATASQRQQASAPARLRDPKRQLETRPVEQIEEQAEEVREKLAMPPELMKALRSRLLGGRSNEAV